MIDFPITARMEKCLQAGDMDHLHLVLVSWPAEELNLLLADLRMSYQTAVNSLDAGFREVAQREGISRDHLQARYQAYRAERIALLELFMEIQTAAKFRLDALNHKVETTQ
jgi:hypothetical protein